MEKFAKKICENKNIILIITGILFLLSIVGIKLTKINYDILVYLPKEIETVRGQNILTNDFENKEIIYALGPVEEREAVLIFNEKTKTVPEEVIEYFI